MANTEKTEQKSTSKTVRMVRYAGKGSERRLSTEDFEKHDVKDQKDARWHNGNGYLVPANYFSDPALEVVLAQPGLSLVDVEVDSNGTPV